MKPSKRLLGGMLAALRGYWRRLGRRSKRLLLLCALVLALLDSLFPPPLPPAEAGVIVLARDGTPLRSWPGADGVWRYPVRISDVSPLYLQAVQNYEDRWFRWHFGVNPFALARAGWQWLVNGRIISGGSTLTMQVARMLEPPPRNLWGKVRQIVRAVQLELHYSKDEILTLYLNQAPMGGIVEGVEMASRTYLGKPSRDLSMAEAAMLAALPQQPSRLRPDRYPQRAQQARDKILDRLEAFGVWSPADVQDARLEKVAARQISAHWMAPLAAQRLRSAARAKKRGRGLDGRLQTVQTTLDVEAQATVERLLQDRIEQLPAKVSMAALVMDSRTLEVLAYVGSADFNDNRRFAHVDMVQGVRSPGSTLKPFLYAMALDDGLIHSESLLTDVPQSFGGYAPGNFQASFSGPVSVSEALQRSLNVPAVQILDKVTPLRFSARLRMAGVRLRMPKGAEPNLSLILGGGSTTLEELVGAYRALAAGGLAGVPRLTPDAPRQESRLMSAGAAFIIRDILETGGHPDHPFVEGGSRPLAWKTGTSFGFRDAWALGVSGAYTVGVWVGRPDGTPNPGFFGANVAAPLLRDIVNGLPLTSMPRNRPATVTVGRICWPLGLSEEATAPELCNVHRTAWILNHTVPPTLNGALDNGLRQTIWVNTHNQRITPACADTTGASQQEAAFWPASLQPWLTPAQQAAENRYPWAAGCAQNGETGGLQISGLENNSVLRATPGKASAVINVTAVTPENEEVYWLLDGQWQKRAPGKSTQQFSVNEPGPHSLTVMNDSGGYARVAFFFKNR